MSPRWEFKPLARGDKIREATQGEFFTTDAIRNPAEAIVRESVQNSLDAALGGPLRVRFYLSGRKGALTPGKAKRYFAGAESHYQAADNGLRNAPSPDEPCWFLVCEDFGTRGLQGDPTQWSDAPGQKNHFFYFFRTEGRSAKSEGDRGRWGLGKYVFPRSSRVHSFVAVTVRADDKRRLLMGEAILKTHRIGTRTYQADGWFGMEDDGLVLPFEDPELIDAFCADFQLQRRSQSGLSVVIPWCDEEMESSHFIAAAARDYFYPILHGDLAVVVETPDEVVTLTADSLEETLRQRQPDLGRELASLLKLSRWAISLSSADITVLGLPPATHSHKWSDEVFTASDAAAHRTSLDGGQSLAFRVPVVVREKVTDRRLPSFFDLFLVRDDTDENGRPAFIREGILISDIRAPRARGIRAMVVVQDGPLATLLGDSENPAHTQWLKNGSNFKDRYVYGASYIDFVTRSVSAVVQAIMDTGQDTDPALLVDYFSVQAVADSPTRRSGKRSGGEKEKEPPHPAPPVPPLPKKPSRFRITRLTGGFSVGAGDEEAEAPWTMSIRAAYNVRRGNAMSRYRPEDFRFDKEPVVVDLTGAEIVKSLNNHLLVEVRQKDFAITVTGFDVNRDLMVQTSVSRGEQ